MMETVQNFKDQGVRNPGGPGGPGPSNILEKNILKIQKKGTLKFLSHYFGPLNNYRVEHALRWIQLLIFQQIFQLL